jgi:type IV pilus assembly protein PilQ
MYFKHLLITTVLLFTLLVTVHDAVAQIEIPRELSPNELVTFDRSLPIKTAIGILSQYSLKYEGKIIIDSVNKPGPINVMVDNMYWKRALEYILRSNLMRYELRENYFEVVPLQEGAAGSKEDMISTTTREIEINAIFFEADYNTIVEAGIDWSVVYNGKVRVSNTFAPKVATQGFEVTYADKWQQWDIFALLRTFESLEKGEFIANPKIKVMDREEGKIKVGENFFLTTEDFAGNTRHQEYESGVILTVTPTFIGTEDTTFIHLDIIAERSNVLPATEEVTKAITESRTQVLLLDGEETVIAGLFANEVRTSRSGIPILKDLPPWFFGLRYLFGYTSRSVEKKELIIILEAKVVPTIADRLRRRTLQKVYLDQLREEFLRKQKQLQSKSSYTPPQNQNTNRRRQ